MSLIKDVEKVIAQLPPKKARMLEFWLKEYKAARLYKQLKAYRKSFRVLVNFKKSKSNSLWN